MKETWDNLAEPGGNNNNDNLLIEYELLYPGTVTLSLVLPNRSSLLYTPFTQKLGGGSPSAWLISPEIKEALPCRSCVSPPPARSAEKLRPSTSSASPSVPQEMCGWGGREKVESWVRRFREHRAIVGELSLSVTDRRLGVKSMIYDCTS
jgi:hypothetical protein